MIGQVFCDFLTVTVPKDDFEPVLRGVEPVLDELCCESKQPGVYINPEGGAVMTGTRGRIGWIQASGGLLASLRAFKLLDSYLTALGSGPHRVTRLDATLDLPIDPRPILQGLYDCGKSGNLRLTRKHVDPRQLHREMRPALYDPSGLDTGTVYVGRKTAELRLKVYDKRNERIDRTGVDPGHHITRYEVTATSKMGVTLRDVVQPAPVFYNFMAPAILTAPEGVPEWQPFTDGGYAVSKVTSLPYEALKRRVESSTELGRLLALADGCGPHGFDLLVSLMRKLHHGKAATATAA